jgi:hypothetical protein
VSVQRPVVSAEDVRAAHRRRELRLVVPSDAIVTPLARDEAARRGIDLVSANLEHATTRSSPAPTGMASPSPGTPDRHVATCDPDDLERVVERVRRQVPDADLAIVREIAERVLARGGGGPAR